MKKCIFSGTFDPPTLGHQDIIDQAAQIFDKVVVAIMVNPAKTPFFSLEERKEMFSILYGNNPKIEVMEWQGAAVDLLKKENTPFYVRGIRNTVDLEYENANFYANRKLGGDIITVYFPAKQEHIHISSTLAKNCIHFEKPLTECVSVPVAAYIERLLKTKGDTHV